MVVRGARSLWISPFAVLGLGLACASSSEQSGDDATNAAGTGGSSGASAGSAGNAGNAGSAGSAGSADAGAASGAAGTSGGSAGGTGGSPAAGSAGTSGSGGNVATTAGAGGSGGSGGSGGVPSVDCVQTAMPDLSGARLHVPIELVAGSEPFELGDEFTTAGGTTYQASALSFFLSHAFLIDTEGGRVPALFSDPDGVPRPYDLLLVNADALEPLSLDLLAPVAAYESLELGVGVPPECNHIDPTRSVFPLNASSGLHWDWAQGYMFIRVEGSVKSGEDWPSFAYHVGFDEVYRVVTLVGDLNALSDDGARLIVDVNRLLEGTTSTSGGVHLMPLPDFADHFAMSGVLALAPPAP